jgi:DNA-binding MarR family transcriptional regulator
MAEILDDPMPQLPGYALRRAHTVVAAELAGRLATLDLRQAEASVLILIGANPGVTAAALGRQLDIQRANMVPLLKRLEDAGLIERQPIDGKSQGLELRPAGQERMRAARAIIDVFEAEVLQRIPAQHRDHLMPALNALWR